MRTSTNEVGYAYNAVGSSGLAFLTSALEAQATEVIKPLTNTIYDKIIDVDATQRGYVETIPAYREDYGTVAGGENFGFQDNHNTDIPIVSIDLSKQIWKANTWAVSVVFQDVDILKLETAARYGTAPPFSIKDSLDRAVRVFWNKTLDRTATVGTNGQPGLFNNPQVTSMLAAPTGTAGGRTWASKIGNPDLIAADIYGAVGAIVAASVYSDLGTPDTALVPWSVWPQLFVKNSAAGNISIEEYITKYNPATKLGADFKIIPIANEWVNALGAGGTNRAIIFKRDPSNVNLPIPQLIQLARQLPTTRKGGAIESIYRGCIGQVQFLRTQPIIYLDGI